MPRFFDVVLHLVDDDDQFLVLVDDVLVSLLAQDDLVRALAGELLLIELALLSAKLLLQLADSLLESHLLVLHLLRVLPAREE